MYVLIYTTVEVKVFDLFAKHKNYFRVEFQRQNRVFKEKNRHSCQ